MLKMLRHPAAAGQHDISFAARHLQYQSSVVCRPSSSSLNRQLTYNYNTGIFPSAIFTGILIRFAPMLSKSFDINTASLPPFDPGTRSLLLEISPAAVSVIFWNKEKNAPEAFEVFAGKFNNAADWELITQQSTLLGLRQLETDVIHAFENMLPIPVHLYTPEQAKAQMELFFGARPGMHTSADLLPLNDMALAWQLPEDLHAAIASHFSVFRLKHVGSCLLKNAVEAGKTVGKIVVYGSQCWVSLWGNGSLLIIKSVAISQADDLSWHLLNACQQFNLQPEEVSWEIAGMAEENSPLWAAVTRFFEPVQAMAPQVELPEELPGHYFAHLYQYML
jgi:hypothetical protein